MDIASIAKSATALALGIVDTALVSATIYSGRDIAFTWATDTAVESGGVTSQVKGLKYDLKQEQGSGNTAWRTEFLVEGVKVPASIDEAARIEIGAEKWNIVHVNHIPTDAVVIFGLRK